MRSRFVSAILALCAASLGCGSTNTDPVHTCNPACSADQYCGTDLVCHDDTDGSTPDAGPADAGGCTTDAQCGSEIFGSSGTCVPSECDPACNAWETCTQRTCTLTPGRCNTDSDCTADTPVCGSNKFCTAPSVTPPTPMTYPAVIITNQAYSAGFQQLAQLHTLTGVPTQVVTVESICSQTASGCNDNDGCHDTAKAIKDYLIAQQALGLQEVVLGGDASIVTSRATEAKYSNALYGVSYDEIFYSDYYFSDLSNWDTNNNCVYGEDSDTPTYAPTIGVSRVSVSSPAELQAYIAKAAAYLTAYDTTRLNKALFLSNVATDITVGSTTIPIDSALYFETPGRTLSQMPSSFSITKLYSSLSNWPGASALTVPAEEQAFESGYNIAVHSGHGDEGDVTVEQDGSNEFSGDMAYALQNSQYPILISCACEAATFADGDACAGQQFTTAPNGGGIGYLGNATIGLGIAGGMQLIDQFLKYAFSKTNPLANDVLMAAHKNMPTSDGFTFTVAGFPVNLTVVDPTSWRWTQKAVTYLGDGLLPIYTETTMSAAPTFTATRTTLGNFTTITVVPTAAVTGTMTMQVGSNVYQFPYSNSAASTTITVAGNITTIPVGFVSANTLAAYQQITMQ